MVIEKAQRETRFRARAARIDSTVVEADIRYPSDAMLALQGARTLAREGRKLSRMIGATTGRVRDRSRSIGKTVRAISKTLARRTGEAKAAVMALNQQAGQLIARSAREAKRLASVARACARGRGRGPSCGRREPGGARGPLWEGRRADRSSCPRAEDHQPAGVDRRPDARPIRKGKLGKPTEFGYVAQICEVTENTHKRARPWGIAPPPAGVIPTALWTSELDEAHPPAHARRVAELLGGDPPVTVVPGVGTFGLGRAFPDVLRFAVGR